MHTSAKLDEAAFFLELLDALDQRKRPLTHAPNAALEASYLLSAILGALSGALDQAKPIAGVAAVVAYKKSIPSVFDGKDALRNMTIHERHVDVAFSGYIPPSGQAVNFSFRHVPLLVEEERKAIAGVILQMGPSHYIEVDGVLREIVGFCFTQFKHTI